MAQGSTNMCAGHILGVAEQASRAKKERRIMKVSPLALLTASMHYPS